MGIFGVKNSMINVIRCDEPSYLIWKWHPENSSLGENKRENSIRFGSSLRVKDGEIAVFVYRQKNEVIQDIIVGPFDKILETNNLPVISRIFEKAYGGNSPFQAEVYFVNIAEVIHVNYGVPYFDVYDCNYTEFSVPVAVRGSIIVKINDYSSFIKKHQLRNYSVSDFQKEVKDILSNTIKNSVSGFSVNNNVPVVQIESRIEMVSELISNALKEKMISIMGVELVDLEINAIDVDKSSEDYKQLMSITKDVTVSTARAKHETNIKNIYDQQRIDSENYEESLRIQREESQYAQRKQTQTANFSAYQTEAKTNVGIAGAEALGKMRGGLFNSSGIIPGIILGQAVSENIKNSMNGISNADSPIPPPIPETSYHVAVNGVSQGPLDKTHLRIMFDKGEIDGNTLVWKPGMPDWKPAIEIAELGSIFNNQVPPPIR